MHLKSNIGWLS